MTAPAADLDVEQLFTPFKLRNMHLPSRFVMTPMVRPFSPGGVPDKAFAPYYRRRAEGGCGLILSGGAAVRHPVSEMLPNCAQFHGEEPLKGWAHVVEEVHAGGACFIPQLYHAGLARPPVPHSDPFLTPPDPELPPIGPSGLHMEMCFPGETVQPPRKVVEPMTQRDIDDVVAAFGEAAVTAQSIGADGVEVHGGHGFLVDQFLWARTNRRTDGYGGDAGGRARFAAEVVREIRRRVGPDYPIFFRFSQWKQQDYDAKLAETPDELAQILEPLADAGVDLFDCSTRRFWEPAFAGSDLGLAGWTKKLTGLPTMTVGSLGLEQSNASPEEERKILHDLLHGEGPVQLEDSIARPRLAPAKLEAAVAMFERGEFDLLGVGRSALVNPRWPDLVRKGAYDELKPFDHSALLRLE